MNYDLLERIAVAEERQAAAFERHADASERQSEASVRCSESTIKANGACAAAWTAREAREKMLSARQQGKVSE